MKKKLFILTLLLSLCMVTAMPAYATPPELSSGEIMLTQDNVTIISRGDLKESMLRNYRVTYDVFISTRVAVNKPFNQVTSIDFDSTIRYTEPAPDGSAQQAFGVLDYSYHNYTGQSSDGKITFYDVFYAGEMAYYVN